VKRMDVVIALFIDAAAYLGYAIATGAFTPPSASTFPRTDAAIHLTVMDEVSGDALPSFGYTVYDSRFQAVYTRHITKWTMVEQKANTPVTIVEDLEHDSVLVVHLDGYKDCALWNPEPGQSLVFWMSLVENREDSRVEESATPHRPDSVQN